MQRARIRRQCNHGNWRWVVDYRDEKGRRHQVFRASEEEARQFAMNVPPPKRANGSNGSLTCEQVLDAYVNATRHRRNADTDRSIVYRARSVLAGLDALGVVYAHQFTDTTFGALRDYLEAQGLAEATVHGYLAVFRAATRYAAFRGALRADALGIMELPGPQERSERFLSKDEIGELLAALNGDPLQLPCAVSIYQGLRLSEVCRLDEGDVDIAANRLSVGHRTKNRRVRHMQVHPALLPYLPGVLATGPVPLCRTRRGGRWTANALTRGFRRKLDALGERWADVHFHTLRHTCASQMAMAGYGRFELAGVLGHRTLATTERYVHLMPDQVKLDW